MGSDDLCVNRRHPLQSGMEPGLVTPPNAPRNAAAADLPARDTFTAQTPLVVIGLAAIGMIFLINSHARPTPPREKAVVYSCSECGTVVAVGRRMPQSYVVEIQMLDGSLRTIPQTARGVQRRRYRARQRWRADAAIGPRRKR